MKIIITSFLVLVLTTWSVFAADNGIQTGTHAVISPNGSVEYYKANGVKRLNDKNIEKKWISEYLSITGKNPKVYELKNQNNTSAGYMVVLTNSEKSQPISHAIDNGYKVKATSFDQLPSNLTKAYAFSSDTGKVNSLLLSNGSSGDTAALEKLIPLRWSVTKVDSSSSSNDVGNMVPIPRNEFIKRLRISMLDQATELACKSKIRPKEISVTASLGASVGFIVGGEGTISFAATWETADLCSK
jgi:hypothetical protein